MSKNSDMLTIEIASGDLPRPGEDLLVVVEGTPYEALIVHTGAPEDEVDTESETSVDEADPAFSYTVVDVFGATRTHAALVRHHLQRTVVNRYTLCSQNNSRRVRSRRRDQPLNAVTCTQCTKRLEAAGEL